MTAEAAVLPRSHIGDTIRNYVALTKPRVIVLLLVTTVPAMVVADHGWPSTWLVLATLLGGTLSAGGANAINCWYDRDIDAIMKRTRSRPLVTGEVAPAQGLAFGISLGAGAFLFLWATTTPVAALLSLTALLFYVFVYTIWLKRRTPHNIVIGGAAGAFPPMVGWAAVTGDISLAPLVMFAIIFFWTPPHFWALSLRLRNDYADAGVPMLPVTDGPEVTRAQILRYSVMLVAVSLLLGPAGELRWIYFATALVTGGIFVAMAFKLFRAPERTPPMSLYKYSLLYLAVMFVAMGVDAAIFS
ncbi:MAG: protoheme IX farnesyltransferase [Anaerolinea sp.]|nr:protoheme IX farnesyltransferase [Anaerolinea sp.]